MEKIFKIEWSDDLGPEWLCKENLENCLFSETHITNVSVNVTDISKKEISIDKLLENL